MNQTVVRMYLLIIVGLAATIGAGWPRFGPFRWSTALARFAVLAGAGSAFILLGFHSPGRVDGLRLETEAVLVQETFLERAWGETVWTAVGFETGAVEVRLPDPEAREPPRRAPLAMRLTPSISARLERVASSTVSRKVGPKLRQPRLAWSGPAYAVVAAYDEIYDPTTLFVARYGSDGAPLWRVEGTELGLGQGRLRSATPVPGTEDLLLVFTGTDASPSLYERLTLAEHVFVARLGKDGAVKWRRNF